MAIRWITGYPRIVSNTTGTTVMVSGQINQSGTIRMVIVPNNSGVPTAAQIWAGKNSTNGGFPSSGFANQEVVHASGDGASLSGYGLSSQTQYKACIVASGYTDKLLGSGYVIEFTTPDVTAPVWTTGYPTAASTTTGKAANLTLNVTVGEATGYYFVCESGTINPTVAYLLASGTVKSLPLAATDYAVTWSGLSVGTKYMAYFVAKDEHGNVQASGVHKHFTATDSRAPAWVAKPTLVRTSSSSALFSSSISDTTGSGFILRVANGFATPTSNGIATSGTLFTYTASGLASTVLISGMNDLTSYDAWFVAKDSSYNLQSSGYKVDFTTKAVTWTHGYPTVNTAGTTANIVMAANTAGSGFWVVLPATSGAINVLQTISGVNMSGSAVRAGWSGNFEILTSGTIYSGVASNLTSETAYVAYVALKDDNNNVQASGYHIDFTTTDVTAPTWAANYPSITAIAQTTATINFRITDSGNAYFIVEPTVGTTAPSAAQIRAGTNANGTAIPVGRYGTRNLTANTANTYSITNLAYSTNYTVYATARDESGNNTAAVVSATFTTLKPKVGLPGRYSINRITKDRQRLGNQMINTLRR